MPVDENGVAFTPIISRHDENIIKLHKLMEFWSNLYPNSDGGVEAGNPHLTQLDAQRATNTSSLPVFARVHVTLKGKLK